MGKKRIVLPFQVQCLLHRVNISIASILTKGVLHNKNNTFLVIDWAIVWFSVWFDQCVTEHPKHQTSMHYPGTLLTTCLCGISSKYNTILLV